MTLSVTDFFCGMGGSSTGLASAGEFEQMAMFAVEEMGVKPSGIIHIITPDMGTLCRDDLLEAVNRGDRCSITPHRHGWRNITCIWCRAAGRAYYSHVSRISRGFSSSHKEVGAA